MKTYTFHISVPRTGRTWRKIEMRADQTLHRLHLAIQAAFEFDNDHLYAFFMSGKAWDKRTEYRLSDEQHPWPELLKDEESGNDDPPLPRAEVGEMRLRQLFGSNFDALREHMAGDKWADMLDGFAGPGDALITKLAHLNLELDQKFLYLFDFGDEWRFTVRVHAINRDAPDGKYPRIVESVGNAPQQYPEMR